MLWLRQSIEERVDLGFPVEEAEVEAAVAAGNGRSVGTSKRLWRSLPKYHSVLFRNELSVSRAPV